MWIQPLVHRTGEGGRFSGLVYLGKADVGAGQHFKIYLFACEDESRYRDGEQILHLPKDCLVSNPVEVVRER
jgi:hypothetical protein